MELPTIWFFIIASLFTGFFFLEGFDYGVGMLLPFLPGNETSKRMVLGTIGGVWDGNEVWLIAGGAALFAAFPNWYATLFSGLYPVFLLILLALILRGVAFRFRDEGKHPAWRGFWDWMIFLGSFFPAFLWGLTVGNLISGVPVNEHMIYTGRLTGLFNLYGFIGGIVFVSLFLLHGANFLRLKMSNDMAGILRPWLFALYLAAVSAMVAFLVLSGLWFSFFETWRVKVIAGIAVAALCLCGLTLIRRQGWAFVTNGLVIILLGAAFFAYLYPRVLISTLNPDWSLTVWNACSSSYSLKMSSWVALIFIPLVLLYEGWSYWILRKRIGKDDLDY